jgi:dipeptide transport system ATP-binding protein
MLGEGAGLSGAAAPVIEAAGLVKLFARRRASLFAPALPPLRAVDGVSFALVPGRTLALVGESGCGKSTTARMLLLLEQPDGGTLRFDQADILRADAATLRRYRGSVQAVFQDPWSSLNPRMRIGRIIAEPLRLNAGLDARSAASRVATALEEVGLDPASARNFPHEFSGGQRQRIAIARAIVMRPRVVVLDEPVSALDVSVRLQIINLLIEAQRRLGMSYLLISHDLATVRYQADEVAVMYRGRIVEHGDAEAVFDAPLHPYTQALLAAARFVRPEDRDNGGATVVADETDGLEQGCRFAGRCPSVHPVCRSVDPDLAQPQPGHAVACHLHTSPGG